MSTIKVNNLSGKGGATPNLPDGAVISGVATVTNLKPTNVNVSGAVTATTITATTFDGSLNSTGTPTLGLGVTINSSGLVVSGVTTAGIGSFTTVYGDGSNLTGVGGSIGVWYYNPDVNDSVVTFGVGIGLTFSTKVEAGSGTATLKIVNAGVAGTTIQSWGVGSCTFGSTVDTAQNLTFGALVSDLETAQTYQFDIPEGFVKDTAGTEYVGTAWTFAVTSQVESGLYAWGTNTVGALGQNQGPGQRAGLSSPTQIGSLNTWVDMMDGTGNAYGGGAINKDGELFMWGDNQYGECGNNTITNISSPTQIPGSWGRSSNVTFGTREKYATTRDHTIAIKSNGTLWMWGRNDNGDLGQNNQTEYSSPVQIGSGTDWEFASKGKGSGMATKTDGTLWAWGSNNIGQLGQNQAYAQLNATSSPVQIPGTTWNHIACADDLYNAGIKDDGTLWIWGKNQTGELGQNNVVSYSSPVQIPGTTWATIGLAERLSVATKTDGTLWAWGMNQYGQLGQNNRTNYSSPVQVPGTSWPVTKQDIACGEGYTVGAIKTDKTYWKWGQNEVGELGQNQASAGLNGASSPVQVPGSWQMAGSYYDGSMGLK